MIFSEALRRRFPSLSTDQYEKLRGALGTGDRAYVRATLMDLCSFGAEGLTALYTVESTLRRDWENAQRLALEVLDERWREGGGRTS